MDKRKFNIGDIVIIKDDQLAYDYDGEYGLIIGYSLLGYQAYTFYHPDQIETFNESIYESSTPKILYESEIRKYEHISDCEISKLYFVKGMDLIINHSESRYKYSSLIGRDDYELYTELTTENVDA